MLLGAADHASFALLACSGVEVEFPYDAYPCQLDYMTKVVQALQQVGPSASSQPRLQISLHVWGQGCVCV